MKFLEQNSTSETGNALVVVVLVAAVIVSFAWYFLAVPDVEAPAPTPIPAAAEQESSVGESDATSNPDRLVEEGGPSSSSSIVVDSTEDRTVHIFGVVKDSTGEPVSSVKVALFSRASSRTVLARESGRFLSAGTPPEAADARIETADDGAFAVDWSPSDGVVSALLTFDDPATSRREVAVVELRPDTDREEIVVTLSDRVVIAGRVLTYDDEPAVGMRVFAAPAPGVSEGNEYVERIRMIEPSLSIPNASGSSIAKGMVDELGEFFVSCDPGSWSIRAETAETVFLSTPRSEHVSVRLVAGRTPPRVELRVERGGMVRGQVFDANQKPLEGVRVSAVPHDVIKLAFEGDMEGVRDMMRVSAKTDSRGQYVMRAVQFESRFYVAANHDEWANCKSESLILTREEPVLDPVDIVMTAGASIAGQVVDAAGNPVPELSVFASPTLAEMMSGLASWTSEQAATDEDGRFRFDHIPAGNVRVAAGQSDMFQSFEDDPASVTLEIEGDEVFEVALIYDGEEPGTLGGELRGVVVDAEGVGIAGASLSVSAAGTGFVQGTTDETGSFVLEGMGEDAVFVQVSAEGYTDVQTSATPGSDEQIFRLQRLGRIRGRVLTQNGLIPTGVKISYRHSTSSETDVMEMTSRLQRAMSGDDDGARIEADGSFELVGVAPGNVVVSAQAEGFAPGTSSEVVVISDETTDGVEVYLSQGSSVSGVVRDSVGQPVARATVRVRVRGQSEAEDLMAQLMPGMTDGGVEATTDSTGAYEVDHLAAGSYVIQASHRDLAPSEPTRFDVGAETTQELPDLIMSVGGTIRGRLVDADGKPRAGQMIQVMSKSGGMKMATSAADGRFEWTSLAPGKYLLTVTDLAAAQMGKMKIKTRAVVVEGSELHEVEIVYGQGFKVSGKIEGRTMSAMQPVYILRRDGTSTKDINPMDLDSQHQLYRSLVGMCMVTQGEFVIDDVPPGEYVIEVPAMPENPMDMAGYAEMDKTPVYRRDVTVRSGDLKHDIHID